MYEVCEDCGQMTLTAWICEHDDQLMEYYCRNCEIRFVDPIPEEMDPWTILTRSL